MIRTLHNKIEITKRNEMNYLDLLDRRKYKSPWPEKIETSRPKRIPPRIEHTQALGKYI